jgi:predicted nucleotidyltransferase
LRSGINVYGNLSPDADCVGAWSAGKIVQRKFANDGVTMTGFVMENSDGSREFINVNSIPIGEVDRATVSWVERGLHTLLAEGRLAEIYVRLCGASGRVQMLDAVQ